MLDTRQHRRHLPDVSPAALIKLDPHLVYVELEQDFKCLQQVGLALPDYNAIPPELRAEVEPVDEPAEEGGADGGNGAVAGGAANGQRSVGRGGEVQAGGRGADAPGAGVRVPVGGG